MTTHHPSRYLNGCAFRVLILSLYNGSLHVPLHLMQGGAMSTIPFGLSASLKFCSRVR